MLVDRPASHLPPGFPALVPYLTVDSPEHFLEFAKAAFSAQELVDQRFVAPNGKLVHTAIRIEGCLLEVGRADEHWRAFPAAIHLYVPDVDASYSQALKAGGVSLHEVRDMDYGERSGAVRDPAGNNWYIATYTGAPHQKS